MIVAFCPPPLRVRVAPTVNGTRTTSQQTTGVTAHVVTLPGAAGSLNGKRVIIEVHLITGGDTIASPAAGWLRITAAASISIHAFYRDCDGSEAASVTFTTSGNSRSNHFAYPLTGYDPAVAPTAGTESSGTSANPDPPVCTPASSYAYLSLASCLSGLVGGTITIAPSGYGNLTTLAQSAGAPNSGVAELAVTAASENPGTFTASGSAAWKAQTIMVKGI